MDKKPQIIITANLSELARAGADIFALSAKDAVGRTGRFAVGISGGEGPRPVHQLLAMDPYLSEMPWSETHVFWVDERCVPVNDPASNYGNARNDFLDMVPVPFNQIHMMPAALPPDEGASKYEKDLRKFFQTKRGAVPVFDLIYLGIGPDGHTASLFPEGNGIREKKRLILAVKGGNPYVHRLTMTLPVLNNAKTIVFAVSGKSKAQILRNVLMKREEELPAQMIRPVKGRLIWLLDREAASLLTGSIDPAYP
jgi:6-phosphogluconolactonase